MIARRCGALMVIAMLVAVVASGARAADEPDVLQTLLFAPELVMQHQKEIALTSQQRYAITKMIGQTQAKVLDLQWRLEEERKALADILSRASIDVGEALEQGDEVLTLERDIKREQLALLIRIKNTLTPAQQKKLRTIQQRGS